MIEIALIDHICDFFENKCLSSVFSNRTVQKIAFVIVMSSR